MLFNYASKEIIAKIVYYGPGLCGKTTNIQLLHTMLNPDNRGKLISLATDTDRTLFFDFLPMDLGTVRGFKIRIQLYTVPGQVHYNATRKLVLKGADAVVFVADSQVAMSDQNIESLQNLRQNLKENDLDPNTIPLVLQYNKRDLPNVADVQTLDSQINDRKVPWFEAVAFKGDGVVETFQGTLRCLLEDLNKKHSFDIDLDKVEMLARNLTGMSEKEAAEKVAEMPPVAGPQVEAVEEVAEVSSAPEETIAAPADISIDLSAEPENVPGEPVAEAPEEKPSVAAASAPSRQVAGEVAGASDLPVLIDELRGIRQGIADLTAEIRGLSGALERMHEANRKHLSSTLQGIESRIEGLGEQMVNQGMRMQQQLQEDQGMALKAIIGKIDTVAGGSR